MKRYRVVSTYQDGERITEAVVYSRRFADRAKRRIEEFRADQDEGPAVTIEPAPAQE